MIKQSLEHNIFSKKYAFVAVFLSIVAITGALLFAAVRGDVLTNVAIIAALIGIIALILQADEFLVVLVMVIKLYIDFYLGLAFVAQVVTLLLLFIFFLRRSSSHPWVNPRALWLWLLFIAISIFPALRGVNALDSLYYYFNVIFFPLTVFWLGLMMARNPASVHLVFKLLTAFGTLIAVITIIQSVDGVLLFKSTRYDAALNLLANYQLGNSGIARAGAYLVNPDSNGGFLGLMLLIPVGLLVLSTSLLERLLYCLEVGLLSFALLSTYTTSAWIGVLVGVIILFFFIGQANYRMQFLVVASFAVLILVMFFPTSVNLQLQHAFTPSESSLRIAAWQTGIQVIRAFPFTGLGIGRYVYFERADPYRVIGQYLPLDHPHNSYLELAALGGIQVSVIFIALILFALWCSLKNWRSGSSATRTLIATGMAVVMTLSVYSMANAGWTFVPLASIGWLVLGLVASPLWSISKNERIVKEVKKH